MADVEHGVGQRDLRRAAPRAPWRCARACAARRASPRARPATSKRAACAAGAHHEAAQQRRRRRCPGWPSSRVAAASRSASSSKIESAAISPATYRRRARPEPAGERDLRADRELEVVGRVQRLERPHGEVAPVARDLQVGVDARSARSPRPRAPRAGRAPRPARRTPARGWPRTPARGPAAVRCISTSRRPARRRRCPARRARPSPACASAVCGSLRPWPVSTQTTRSAPVGAVGQQAGHAGRRRRLAEHALVARPGSGRRRGSARR